MKNRILFILVLVFTILITGCNKNSKLPQSLVEEKIINKLTQEIPGNNNFKIITMKNFQEDKKIVLFTYDIAKTHFVQYRFVEINKDNISIYGGAGYVDTNLGTEPLTFNNSSSIYENNKNYLITYGEILDNNIKNIKLIYNDNTYIIETVNNHGYLVIKEGKFNINNVIAIEGLDDKLNSIYKFP